VDLFDVVRSCARRWYVVLPVILASLAFAYKTYSSVEPVYYSNAVVALAPTNRQVIYAPPGETISRNGLLDAGGASLLANLTVLGLSDSAVRQTVSANGGSPDYTVRMFPTPATAPPLPLIMVESTRPDPESSKRTAELVVQQAGSVLRSLQRQAGVPDDQMVTALTATPPGTPIIGTPSRTRSAAAIFAAGTGVALVSGVAFDTIILRRSSRTQNGGASLTPSSVLESPSQQTADRGYAETGRADPSGRS